MAAAQAVTANARGVRSDTWHLAIAAGCHVLLFAVVFTVVWPLHYSSLPLFHRYGSAIVAGQLPYRDFAAEYPPLAMAFFALPRLLTSDVQRYAELFRVLLVACDLTILALLASLARLAGRGVAPAVWGYTLGLLVVGPVAAHQYDLLPAMLCTAALWAAVRGHDAGAGALFAAGTMAKVYPLLLVPLVALWYLRNAAWKGLARAAGGFTLASLVVLLPWLAGGPSSLMRVASYHAGRGLQLEGAYASAIVAWGAARGSAPATEVSAGSVNLAGYHATAAAATWVMLLLLAAAYALAWRRLARGPLRPQWLLPWSLVVLLAGVLGSKVLSPQYLLWILPLVPLAAPEGKRATTIIGPFVVSAALTDYVFPSHYQQLVDARPTAAFALLLRNILLLAMAVLVARLASPAHDHGRQLHPHDHQA